MSSEWPSFTPSVPSQYAQATVTSRTGTSTLKTSLISAFEDAMALRGLLKEEVYKVPGFSGRKFRLFMNNIVREMGCPRYLEIGMFRGASFCSAIYKNSIEAVGIDNWTQFNVKSDEFFSNLSRFKHDGAEVTIIESDFRKVDFSSMGKFNLWFYDGSHAEKDQYDGVMCPQPAIADESIMIVDDWNWAHVRRGTFDALRDGKLTVEFQIEVRTTFSNENLPFVHGQNSEWHNGCLLAVVKKANAA